MFSKKVEDILLIPVSLVVIGMFAASVLTYCQAREPGDHTPVTADPAKDKPAAYSDQSAGRASLGQQGNSNGNIANMGSAAADRDWIYFINYYDQNRIYRIGLDGESADRISHSPASFLNVLDGWIYYSDWNSGNIYKMRTGGSEVIRLNDDDSWYIHVDGTWIYYTNRSDEGRAYRIRTDGTNRERLTEQRAEPLALAGDWLYFISSGETLSNGIYKMHSDSGEKMELTASPAIEVVPHGDTVYYLDQNQRIMRMDQDGGNPEVLNEEQSLFLNVCGDWIYFNNSVDNNDLYRVRLDGSGKTRLSDHGAFVMFINVVGDWIFYEVEEKEREQYRVRIDGSDRQRLDRLLQ